MDDKVIRVEIGSDLNSEKDEKKKEKKPAKEGIRKRKVHFENERKRKKDK